MATGFVDAYTFIGHGHVFAEAMTGNLVLVAVGAVEPGIVAFWRPLSAFAAFVAGVGFAAWRLSPEAGSRREAAMRLFTLALEAVVLAVIGALPATAPQWAVVAAIAFVSGLQIATFRRIDGQRVTATVMTTNSARTIEAIARAARSRRSEDLKAGATLLLSVSTFVLGTFAGAVATSQIGARAAWIVAGLFAVAAVLTRVTERPAAPG